MSYDHQLSQGQVPIPGVLKGEGRQGQPQPHGLRLKKCVCRGKVGKLGYWSQKKGR